MDQQQYEQYRNFYYLVGTPLMASEALSCFLNGPSVANAEVARPTGYFFARIAQLNPPVLRQYETLARGATAQGRAFILQILEQSGDEGTRRFLSVLRNDPDFIAQREQISHTLQVMSPSHSDILHGDIRDVVDIDLLWAEFAVTASKVAVRRIIQVLEWPDRIRGRLEMWLKIKPSRGFLMYRPDERRKQIIETLGKVAGIVCDSVTGEIANREDLDCLCFLDQLQKRPGDQVEKITRALPVTLTSEDLQQAIVRTSAAWSLGEYARRHELVRAACEEELTLLSNRARLTLIEILGRAYLDIEDFPSARVKLAAYCESNPGERKVREKLRLAQAEEALEKLSAISLEADTIDLVEVDPADPDARRCATATAQTTAYRSWLTLRDLSRDNLADLDYVIARWRFTHLHPDRFHVGQVVPWFWQESPEDGDVDEWITIGAKHHYQNATGWVSVPGDPQSKLNSFLTVHKFVALMRSAPPAVVGAIETAESRTLLMEFEFPRINDFFSFDEILHWYLHQEKSGATPTSYTMPPGGAPLNYHHLQSRWGVLRVLADPATGHLLKASLVVGGPEPNAGMPQIIVEQVFGGYDDGFRIEAPKIAK